MKVINGELCGTVVRHDEEVDVNYGFTASGTCSENLDITIDWVHFATGHGGVNLNAAETELFTEEVKDYLSENANDYDYGDDTLYDRIRDDRLAEIAANDFNPYS
jgi:hypothetical protein